MPRVEPGSRTFFVNTSAIFTSSRLQRWRTGDPIRPACLGGVTGRNPATGGGGRVPARRSGTRCSPGAPQACGPPSSGGSAGRRCGGWPPRSRAHRPGVSRFGFSCLVPRDVLLGSLARGQFHDLYERGVPWRRGPGLPLSALGGLRPTPDRPVVGALGRCGWKVVRQVDHPRACRKMIVYISVSVMN